MNVIETKRGTFLFLRTEEREVGMVHVVEAPCKGGFTERAFLASRTTPRPATFEERQAIFDAYKVHDDKMANLMEWYGQLFR